MPRLLLWVPILLAPSAAFAHSPMPGIGYFYSGILHPLLVPSHLLALVALGLLIGQRGLQAMRLAYTCFLVALLVGLAYAGYAPESISIAETLLLVAAGGCGLLVAANLALPPALLAMLTVVAAFVIGADSGVTDLERRETFGAMLGAGTGTCIVLIAVAAVAELPRRDWQKILVRVVGSWCAASAALVLALALRGLT